MYFSSVGLQWFWVPRWHICQDAWMLLKSFVLTNHIPSRWTRCWTSWRRRSKWNVVFQMCPPEAEHQRHLKLPRLSSLFGRETKTTWMVSLWDILFFCGLLNDLLFLWQKSSHLLGILWLRPHWGCLLQYSDQSLCPASQLHRCLWGTPLSVPLDLGMPPPLPVARYWIGWSRGRYILIQLHLTQPWTQNSGDAFYRYFWGFDLYAYVSNCFRSSLAKTFVRLGWNHSKKQEIQRSYCNILQHRSLANLTMRSWMLQCVLVGPTKRGLVSRRVKYESALKMRFCTEWNDQERRWFQEKFAHV